MIKKDLADNNIINRDNRLINLKKNSYNYTYNCFDREIYEDFINENIEKSSSEIVNVEDIYNYFYDNLIDDYKLVDFDLKITENYLKSDSYKGFHNLFVKDIINIFKELEFEKMQSKKKDENSGYYLKLLE